ncbi:MAG: formylmethanofuran dehydrogenase subunit B [Planctomycetales bacterium]|nr:formylmethanofuran dehydrogenase subunit B [Planctomycetales bacterium]
MCGCVCDDLQLDIHDNAIASVQNGCSLSEPWFAESFQLTKSAAAVQVNGRPVDFETGLQRATELLRSSRSPLVYGLSRSSTPGQRQAVRLADAIGAVIDTTASTCHAPSIMALQAVGESTCSLGEVKNRSDLVVYWGSNPMKSHPRHMEKYVEAAGMWVPNGRTDRHLMVIDTKPTETSELADSFIQVAPGRDFELMAALRMVLQGQELTGSEIARVEVAEIQEMARRFKECQYGVIFFGLGITRCGVPHANVEMLLRLVTDLNRYTRFVVRRMRIPGDVAGADSVLCWQTGFPFSVSLNRAYPRYNPGEYSANPLLERQEADVAVLVGTEGVNKLSLAAQANLQSIPTIVLDYPNVSLPFEPTVLFRTGVYGLHYHGTAYRMDEMPIPLKACLSTDLPSDHYVLAAIRSNLQETRTA